MILVFIIIFILILFLLNNTQKPNNIYLYVYQINLVLKNKTKNIKDYFKKVFKKYPDKKCVEPAFVTAAGTDYTSHQRNHVPLYKMTKLRTLDLSNTNDIIGYVAKYLDINYDKNIEK